MRRYLEPSTPLPTGRYGLALTEPAPRRIRKAFARGFRSAFEPAELTEVPLTSEQCLALASYQRPTSRIACCPIPAPIAPSDATEWVL